MSKALINMKTFEELKTGDTVFYAEFKNDGSIKNKKMKISIIGGYDNYIGIKLGENCLDSFTVEKNQHTSSYFGDLGNHYIISTDKKILEKELIKRLKNKIKINRKKLQYFLKQVSILEKSLKKVEKSFIENT
jgi:hypothetical protein